MQPCVRTSKGYEASVSVMPTLVVGMVFDDAEKDETGDMLA